MKEQTNQKKKGVLLPALICMLVLTLLCGLIYPLVVTGISQVAFHSQANGSIITVTLKDGTKVDYGSEHIAQTFTKPEYLIGRAAGDQGGAPTNLSPMSEEQQQLVQERIDFFHEIDPDNTAPIPQELVTNSGSGLDPEISTEAAEYQVARIARERGMSEEDVRAVIKKYTKGRTFGILGEPRVNVLKVNLALDGLL